jgi:hypothetical protein
MFLGLQVPDPDPLVGGKDPDPYPYLSHKGVEQTEIMLANRILTQNFSKKLNF